MCLYERRGFKGAAQGFGAGRSKTKWRDNSGPCAVSGRARIRPLSQSVTTKRKRLIPPPPSRTRRDVPQPPAGLSSRTSTAVPYPAILTKGVHLCQQWPMFRRRDKRYSKRAPYYRQKFLCTAGEWRFCQKLEEAVGDRFVIMMQIRVGSLLRCDAMHWNVWGRQVSQKSFDFVLVERGSSYAAAAIELDDKTHLLPERRKRDRFLNDACKAAGLPLIRIKTGRYDVSELRETVREHLPKGACEVRPNSAPSPKKHGKPLV